MKHLSFRSGQIVPDHTPLTSSPAPVKYFDYKLIRKFIPNYNYKAHDYRVKANLLTKSLSQTYQSRRDIANSIIQFGQTYIKMTSDYFITFRDNFLNEEFEVPLYNRFDAYYVQKQRDKLYYLHWFRVPEYFLTITIDFKKYKSIYDGYREMGKEWNRLLSHLKKFDKNVQFTKVYEIQTLHTMNVHAHIVLQTVLEYDKILEIVDFLHIGQEHDLVDMKDWFFKKNHRSPTHSELAYMASKYILKYISKGYNEDGNFKNNLNRFILWALGARTFSYSYSMQKYRRRSLPVLDFAYKTNSNHVWWGEFSFTFVRFKNDWQMRYNFRNKEGIFKNLFLFRCPFSYDNFHLFEFVRFSRNYT